MKVGGTIDKYKARLVAKGYHKKEGQDFFDTYFPMKKIMSMRMLIAIATLHNLEIHQMYIKTAFLNGDLEQEVYLKQLEGFVVKGWLHSHSAIKTQQNLYYTFILVRGLYLPVYECSCSPNLNLFFG